MGGRVVEQAAGRSAGMIKMQTTRVRRRRLIKIPQCGRPHVSDAISIRFPIWEFIAN